MTLSGPTPRPSHPGGLVARSSGTMFGAGPLLPTWLGTCTLLALAALAFSPIAATATVTATSTQLAVPVVQQQPERCGQAALVMVLRYWGAGGAALGECASAYDPVLRGSLVTDVAAAARRAGFDAEVAGLDADSLIALVRAGVPPIVLYQNGRWLTVRHFAVVTGWDPARRAFTLNDGTSEPRTIGRADLDRRWKTAGSQAVIVRKREP